MRERERGVGGRAGQQAVIFKVRLGLGEIEIERERDRGNRWRDSEIERH